MGTDLASLPLRGQTRLSLSCRFIPPTSRGTIRAMMTPGTRTASRRWVELDVSERVRIGPGGPSSLCPSSCSWGLVTRFLERLLSIVPGAPCAHGFHPVLRTRCSVLLDKSAYNKWFRCNVENAVDNSEDDGGWRGWGCPFPRKHLISNGREDRGTKDFLQEVTSALSLER